MRLFAGGLAGMTVGFARSESSASDYVRCFTLPFDCEFLARRGNLFQLPQWTLHDDAERYGGTLELGQCRIPDQIGRNQSSASNQQLCSNRRQIVTAEEQTLESEYGQ